jgi:succinate dehydrogenase / fumarate reductase iron-sulfur subunit
MVASAIIPALIIAIARLGSPESPRLACLTKVKDLKRPIKIEPLKNVNIVRGLVPDLTIFFSKYRSVQPFLVAKDRNEQENPTAPFKQNDDEVKRYLQFNYCIQCGLCYSACPIVATNPKFLGPAAIAVAYSYSADSRDYNRKRIDLLNSSTGIWSCRIASSCSVVCPKGVDPSLAIQLTKYSVIRKGKN